MQEITKQFVTKSAAILVALAATIGLIGFNAAAQHGSDDGAKSDKAYMKAQCKHGGWKEMGYRNQGQCVSHFSSGGHGKDDKHAEGDAEASFDNDDDGDGRHVEGSVDGNVDDNKDDDDGHHDDRGKHHEDRKD